MSSLFLEALSRKVELEIIKYDMLPLLFAFYILYRNNNNVITYGNFSFVPTPKNTDHIYSRIEFITEDAASRDYYKSFQNDTKRLICLLENTIQYKSNLISSLFVREGKFSKDSKFSKTILSKDKELTQSVLQLVTAYNNTQYIPFYLACIYLYLFPNEWVSLTKKNYWSEGIVYMKIDGNNIIESEYIYSGQNEPINQIELIKFINKEPNVYELKLMEPKL